MDSKIKTETITLNYVFYDTISRVFEAYTTPKYYSIIHSPLLNELKLLKGQNKLNSIGSEFSCIWRSTLHSKIKVLDAFDTPEIKYFTWYVQNNMCSFTVRHTFKHISEDDITYFISDAAFDSPIYLTPQEYQLYQVEKLIFFKNAEKFLKQIFNKRQTESIVIDTDIKNLFNVFMDWTQFVKHSPIIGQKCENLYNDMGKLIGVKVTVNPTFGYGLGLQKNELYEDYGELIFTCTYSQLPCALQKIYFCLHKIEENKTLLLITHEFGNHVGWNFLGKLKFEKRIVLTQLRDSLKTCN
jgi:hypothetical protein